MDQAGTHDLLSQRKHHHRRSAWWLIVVALLGCGLFFLSLWTGPVDIPAGEVLTALTGGENSEAAWRDIVLRLRLPRAITAILAGAALSIAGLEMQTFFRNPLAGPSVLGISSGASLGVAVVILAGGGSGIAGLAGLGLAGNWLLVGAAALGALGVLLLILGLSTRIRDNVVLLIVGLMVGNITISLVGIWQFYSDPDSIRDFLVWTFGSLGGVTGSKLQILMIGLLAGLVLLLPVVKSLNLLLLGEDYARSMGMPVGRTRWLILVSASLLAATVTAFCGPIAFVGIAVPHLVRGLLRSADHRWLLPGCMIAGATLMLFCGLISQWPGDGPVLPINAVTALIGSPVVIAVIMRRNNLSKSFS